MPVNNQKKMQGKVFLVGAGPGDPGLITLKGLDCIKKADILVYDRLAPGQLLAYASPETELVDVGKIAGHHTLPQEEINKLLRDKAGQGFTVTRLKGGDPFLFGRGGEEAEFLAEHGISFEVVPGITSAVAVPAYAGIPVTHRGFTSSFAVITGHEGFSKEESSIAWDKIATGIGTLVFLMGVKNLPFIVRKLLENGCSPATPAALVHQGTRTEQQTVTGTLADIVERVDALALKSPAVIVIGKVVTLREKLKWREKKPLFGKRIVVTRARSQASKLSRKIEIMGGEPFEFPTIEIAPPKNYEPLDRAISEIETFDWLIFTSTNGTDFFFDRLRHHYKDLRDLKGLRLCAIGPSTAESLKDRYLLVECVPSEYRAEALLAELKGKIKPGHKVLLPRADIARPLLAESLAAMGAQVHNVDAYQTKRGRGNAPLLQRMLEDKLVHAVTFTSSSTVRNFVEIMNEDKIQELLAGVTLASIGPITTKTAEGLGLKIDMEAQEYTIDGLLCALQNYFSKRNDSER